MRNDVRFGDLVKVIWWDGVGMSLYVRRLETGRFIWPTSGTGEALAISAAQLGYLTRASTGAIRGGRRGLSRRDERA